MVGDGDRHLVGALQGPQVAENGGHLAGLVFVRLMQADQGVEEEQTRRAAVHGLGQTLLIGRQIQAYRGGGDDVDG